jgi:hypothetical protein
MDEEIVQEDQEVMDEETTKKQPDIEERARRMGWVPKEEFRGDLETWKDADEFVKYGEEILPVLRERLRKMDASFADLHAKLEEQTKIVKDFAKYHKETEERAYQRALKELKQEQLAAVSDGDAERFLEIEKEIKEMEKPEKAEKEPDDQLPEGFTEWQKDNNWYGVDAELSAYADSIGNFLVKTRPTLKGKAFFKEITRQVKEKFSDRFENPNRKKPASVESGAPGASDTGKKGKTYSDLPPEAKQACDEFVKQGLLKREDYVKEFFLEV